MQAWTTLINLRSATQIPGPWTLLGIYTGKWFTVDEFNLLKTAGSMYHNRVFEFKLPQNLLPVQRKRGRSQPGPGHASCYCDATEAGNATREINHFAALDDDSDAVGSSAEYSGHSSASARFVEAIDGRTGLPHVLVFSTRAMQAGEEGTIEYGANFFDTMQHQEEIKGLESMLKDTERQLKVALEALQAKDKQVRPGGDDGRPSNSIIPCKLH